jgi:exonuclease SbcD
MRLVVFADLHLDATFAWAKADVARQRRQNLRDTLDGIISLAHKVKADALMCGGDLYEHTRITPDTVAFLKRRFNDCEMQVLLAPGNHDWYGPASVYARADWASHVTVFKEPLLTPMALADGFTIWGSAHDRPAGTPGFFDSGFRVDRGGVNVALFHGSERGFLAFEAEGKEPHAGFRREQIAEAGLDYAFAGHYHKPRDEDRLTYPGNPDPLTFGEEPREGAVVADIGDDGSVTIERHGVAVSEVHDLSVDISDCASFQDIRAKAMEQVEGLTGCAQLTLDGELAPDVELRVGDLASIECALDQVVVRVGDIKSGYDLEALKDDPTIRGEYVRAVLAAPDLDEQRRRRILITGLRALDGRRDLGVL